MTKTEVRRGGGSTFDDDLGYVLSVLLMIIRYCCDDETSGCQVQMEGTDDTALGSRRSLIGQKVAKIRRGGGSTFDSDFCFKFFR